MVLHNLSQYVLITKYRIITGISTYIGNTNKNIDNICITPSYKIPLNHEGPLITVSAQ